MDALFLSRESAWSAACTVRGALWKQVLQRQHGVLTIVSLESLWSLERKTDYAVSYKLYLAARVFFFLMRKRFDLLIINKINYHTLGAVVCCWLRRKDYILDVDDWEYRTKGTGKKTLFQRLGDYWALHARLVVVASVFLRDYFHFCPRVAYIPSCPALPPSIAENGRASDTVFGWLGMVDRPDVLESIRTILQAFLQVHRIFPRTKLVIIGKGIFVSGLKQMAQRYTAENIQFHYDVATDALPALIRSMTVGILVFEKDDVFYQAKSPTRLFRYFSFGKPVIASAVGECERYVKQDVNGYVLHDRKELARYMEQVCAKDEVLTRLSRGALATARQWNRDTLAQQLSVTMDEVLCG